MNMKKDIKKKTNKEHFNLFKSECQKWIDKLKLDNWKIYFAHEEMEGVYARIFPDIKTNVATIKMNTEWSMFAIDNLEESIKNAAKHEVIHLLLARLSEYGHKKDYTHDNMFEAEEELVRKLEKIIQ